MVDKVPTPLQESILAALIFDEKASPTIAAQISPDYFDETYREIAEKTLAYRRKYGRCPGIAHLDDLFDRALADRRSRTYQILTNLSAIAPEINRDYVIARTQRFVQEQNLKAALVAGASRWEQGGEEVATDIEAIFYKALKTRTTTVDAGTRLSDTTKALKFLDRVDTGGIPFGISVLDDFKLALRPKEMTLYIGGKGTGKTWAAVHVGKQALITRKRVLRITNEVSE